jgi:formylmethanofuran dehydrogenase subunit D
MASAPAVVEREQAPNRLVVDESSNDDDSVVALNPKRLQELDHYRGDTVLIKGTRDTICVVLADDSCEAGKIRMNAVVRKNLGVRLGDCVSLHEARVRHPGVCRTAPLACAARLTRRASTVLGHHERQEDLRAAGQRHQHHRQIQRQPLGNFPQAVL